MASTSPNLLTRRRWTTTAFVLSFVLVLIASALTVFLQRRLILFGSLSTLGLTAFVYLSSFWCLAAALLGLVLRGGTSTATGIRMVTAVAIVAMLAAGTNLIGRGAYDSASTPLIRREPGHGQPDYLMRLGSVLDSNELSVYRGQGYQFDLVTGVNFSPPDISRFDAEMRLEVLSDGRVVLIYPDRDGRSSRTTLPQ